MIKKEIFKLEQRQEDLTKMFYNGKVIKCLVAPYHTSQYFEENLEWSDNIYIFPENSIPRDKLGSLISMIVSDNKSETIIITTCNELITQMIGDNVRVFTESGNIVPCPIKCLMANIHDIRYSLLENKEFKDVTNNISNFGTGFVNSLINKINSTKIDNKNYESFKVNINLIGEEVIRKSLLKVLDNNRI